MKDNDVPLYVSSSSNHPPRVLRNIPLGVNRRLTRISSSKELFDAAVPQFQEALEKSGHKHKLEYETTINHKKKKNRRRNETWFNPPFSRSLKTNVGKEFFRLLDRSFPPSNPLHKLFTRQTVKLSYKCMPNMATSISRHNSKLLREDRHMARSLGCSCKGGAASCPVQGVCKQEGVVYEACVKERISGKTETYTGLTGRTFKQRWNEHNRDFEKIENRTNTSLSLHIWELKDKGIEFDTSWRILERASLYNPATKKCNLCLKEKYFIMYSDTSSTLNKRSEVFNTCRHRNQSLLTRVK